MQIAVVPGIQHRPRIDLIGQQQISVEILRGFKRREPVVCKQRIVLKYGAKRKLAAELPVDVRADDVIVEDACICRAVAEAKKYVSVFDSQSSAIPQITNLLSDPEPDARKMAAWALYRIAKYIGDISQAVPALQSLAADEDEGVREMAKEALRMAEQRE